MPSSDLELLMRVVARFKHDLPVAVVLAGLPGIPSELVYTVRYQPSGDNI